MPNSNAKVFAPVSLGTLAGVKQKRINFTLAEIQALGGNGGDLDTGIRINSGGYVIAASASCTTDVAGSGINGLILKLKRGSSVLTAPGNLTTAADPVALVGGLEAGSAGSVLINVSVNGVGATGDITAPTAGIDITLAYEEG